MLHNLALLSPRAQTITPYRHINLGSSSTHFWALSSQSTHYRAREVKPKKCSDSHRCKNQAAGKPMAFSMRRAEVAQSPVQSSLAHQEARCSLRETTKIGGEAPWGKNTQIKAACCSFHTPCSSESPDFWTVRYWQTGRQNQGTKEN